ncbi:hypothetical protein AC578_4396 [Pseudocercospora eumusae]|uniref:CENP-V/GFA domain-containing protein n=1 Tax=Pseudocercospora eumusae TaxID=321146 RepID=A0A139H2L0_9PEZI|nr:hypothetical protein AC578_4396 [Pseudocercospora eumusae]
MSSESRTGRCLCGTVKYELSGAALKPYYNTVCHCLNCRRVTGSAFLCASICPRDGFRITAGEEHQNVYVDTNTESGTSLRRVSCDQCASKLFTYTPLWHEIVSVAAGTLDDFDAWTPDTEQWCIDRVPFVKRLPAVSEERSFDEAVKN